MTTSAAGFFLIAIAAVGAPPPPPVAGPAEPLASTPVAEASQPDSTTDPGACVPACRDGYACVEGACISACNPPCGAGQLCTGQGECVIPAPEPAPTTARASAPAPAPPASTAASAGVCQTSGECISPESCIDGGCQISRDYIDRLRRQGKARRASGALLLVTGLAELVAGTVMTAVGNANRRDALAMEADWLEQTGDGRKFREERDKAEGLQIGGGLLLLLGVPSTITGAILLGVGTGKIKRANDYERRVSASASPMPGGGGVSLSGRF